MSQLIKCFFPASLDMIQSDAPVLLSSSVLTSILRFYPAFFHHHLSTHAPIPLNQLLLLHLSVRLFHLVFPSLFVPPLCSTFLHSMQGIGRLILKEEMKARAGCHDNDQWGSRHSSRCSSKEALSNLGYSSLNGCKCVCTCVYLHLEYASKLINFIYHALSHDSRLGS